MKKLKIAQLAPPWLAVPPKKYGGAELIVSYITEGLVKKGHEVTLFASGDSKTSAKLVSVFPKALYEEGVPWTDTYGLLLHAASCFELADRFDIIHNHFGYFGICLSSITKTPAITTYHGNFGPVVEKKNFQYEILKHFHATPLVSISKSQKRVKGLKLNFIDTIYNGIDVSEFQCNNAQGKYLAWMGRITPKKGILEAIEIAKKARIPLKIAAKIDKNLPSDVVFYEKKVKPLIDGKKVLYIGEIGGYKAKSSFLNKAIALLNPIIWEEPFGLVMVEAMACGTPIIAFDRGSVRELVKQNKTGFIVKTIPQAVEAVKKIGTIKREDCRTWVEQNFTKEKMVDQYEALYYKVLKMNHA